MLQIGHLLAAKALPVVDCAAVWATTCFSCAIHRVGWHSNVGSIHLRPKQTATRPEGGHSSCAQQQQQFSSALPPARRTPPKCHNRMVPPGSTPRGRVRATLQELAKLQALSPGASRGHASARL